MKFTAEQIAFLERVIEMDGLEITEVRMRIKGDVYCSVKGDVCGDIEGRCLWSCQR